MPKVARKPGPRPEPLNLRLARLADRSGGPAACWPWLGSVYREGYPAMTVSGRKVGAHRMAYETTHGPIPTNGPGAHGFVVMHTCDVRHCVNPAHLRLGTQRENLADARAKGRVVRLPNGTLTGSDQG